MRYIKSRTVSILLSLAMLFMLSPAQIIYAIADENESNTEASASAEVSEYSEHSEKSDNSVNDVNGLEGDSNDSDDCVASDIFNGKVTAEKSDKTINGVVTPNSGYDLASVRAIYVKDGNTVVEYIGYSKKADGSYAFRYDAPTSDCQITATFYNLKVWDGAVDLRWFDPDKNEFNISNPAELAGLAAIVNGMVDSSVTREDQIIDNEDNRVAEKDGKFSHKFLRTKAYSGSLTEASGGSVEDNMYRMPQAERDQKSNGTYVVKKNSATTKYTDMRYCTVNITSDIDMGSLNYTPIGGKYAMNTSPDARDPITIDTRFQGILNGNGHVIKINCNRYTERGFAYSMNIGFIGYLGGGVDYVSSNAKDLDAEYEDGWVPTVRNVVVEGEVYGRRMVGGIVGRTGETNTHVLVENCANKAYVHNTDMRGAAGIVAAAWGRTVIRNCYNTGNISAVYREAGGIVGSNGYMYHGADIYNCYSVGTVTANEDASAERGIGYDGDGNAPNLIKNCYYLSETKDTTVNSGYRMGSNKLITLDNVRARRSADMKSDEFVETLNTNGMVFAKDTSNINGGYPVLYFEKNKSSASHRITIKSSAHGSVKVNDDAKSVSNGTVIDLIPNSDNGYKLSKYIINGKDVKDSFYVVTEDTEIEGVFEEMSTVYLRLPENEIYSYDVTKIYDAESKTDVSVKMKDGDVVRDGDKLRVNGVIKDGAMPSETNHEFTGKFGNPNVVDPVTAVADNPEDKSVLTVTGKGDVTITLEPEYRGKRWISVADTSWYDNRTSGQKTFVINTPEELGGMAKLLSERKVTFSGMTIKLGSDISLKNNDGTPGGRYWTLAGNDQAPFMGTFDGQGHSITNMHRNYLTSRGSNGGLFGVVKDATIKNVSVQGYFEKGPDTSGAIAGTVHGKTTIENCTANVDMNDAGSDCGGIAGKVNDATLTIKNCENNGKISGNNQLGGLIGNVGDKSSVTISQCKNNASIVGVGYNLGGLIGRANYSSSSPTTIKISQSTNSGAIESSQTSSSTAKEAVGGLIGSSDAEIYIDSCSNTGSVSSKGTTSSVGGIAGYLSNKHSVKGDILSVIMIINCRNTGAVTSNSNQPAASIAGIANINSDSTVKPAVRNCYNSGAIACGDKFATGNVGAVLGTVGNTSGVKNNYALDGCAPSMGKAVTSMSSDDLKNASKKLNSAEFVYSEGSYPLLRWEVLTNSENNGIRNLIGYDVNTRVYGLSRYQTSRLVADALKESEGIDKFKNIIVACGTDYPDALAGGYLAKVKGNAPIIIVSADEEENVYSYVKSNLASDGVVYILGGKGAVSLGFENRLVSNCGRNRVKRLGGSNRYDTNIKILEEAGALGDDVLVCTGTGYADSLSASASGKPILLVGAAANADQMRFISAAPKAYLIGGTGAVSESIENVIVAKKGRANVKRLGGSTRYNTSRLVAEEFFHDDLDAVVLAYGQNFPDGLSGGPLALSMGVPILLTASAQPTEPNVFCSKRHVAGTLTIGGPGLISDEAIRRILY